MATGKDVWKVPRMVVWDVNDTIVVGNIDEAVAGLLPAEKRHFLMHSKTQYDSAMYMTSVVSELRAYRIGRWAVQSLIRTLPLHRLMVDAVRELHREQVTQVIISTSNVPFIYTLLDHYGIVDHFSVIFANEGMWASNDCDSPITIKPMHQRPLTTEDAKCPCNWQLTGICRRRALWSILSHLRLLHSVPWIALMHANWGLCATSCLNSSNDLILSRIGCRPARAKTDSGFTDQTVDKDLGLFNQIKYQHGEDLINILRQPLSDFARGTTGISSIQPTGHKEDPSFLTNTAHYFEDVKLCIAPNGRMCRTFLN